MAIYWTLKSIPEFSQLSAKERGLAWRQAYRRTFSHWQTWVALAASGACTYWGHHLGTVFGYPLLGVAIGGGVGGAIFSQVAIYVARAHYRNILLRSKR